MKRFCPNCGEVLDSDYNYATAQIEYSCDNCEETFYGEELDNIEEEE